MNIFKAHVLFMSLMAVFIMAEEKKSISTMRTQTPPVIDGIVDDDVWSMVSPAADFYRFIPESGGFAPVRTEVRFLYDDVTLYVAATMYEPDPSQIPRQLGKRDDDDVLASWIGLWINPFNDGANEVGFMVTAAGVQVDQKFSPEGDDRNWNPVWTSDISYHADGWSVEMAIPFSQIRFPAKDIQTWGLNMAYHRANVREIYTWTELDKSKDNFALQAGLLHGIKNIETPLRLSFTPYAAVSAEHFPYDEPGKSNISTSYRGGMDLKYGINESFTLDMTLIPDFGQVQSDNAVLNLSPFEVRHDEHRPFFTEGTQLLHKAGIFYSRRVGSTPPRYWQVDEGDILSAGETIKNNPDETQLINATKITGQTVNGIGLGFFNAVTAPVYATLEDSLGNERDYLTNPLTNYNLVVVSKNLNNGSEFSVINTNVQRFSKDDTTDDFRDANVIGFQTRLLTKDAKWELEASGAYNALFYPDSVSNGFNYFFRLGEEAGMFQYGTGLGVESESFNPNDMGFLRQPNEISHFAYAEIRTLDPVWKINEASFEVSEHVSWLYNPRVYSDFLIQANWNVTFKNYVSTGGGLNIKPMETHDYYEPRVDDRVFNAPRHAHGHVWLGSNSNKPFSISGWTGISTKTKWGSRWQGGGLNPSWRVNDQFQVNYSLDIDKLVNDRGFADFDDQDNPVFGKRDHTTITNSIYSQFIFSRDIESDLRLRYYRSSVDYDSFFDLKEDGYLQARDYEADLDEVFNAFTIDAVLTWRFAPGSEMAIIYKNDISIGRDASDLTNIGDTVDNGFFDDLSGLSSQDQSNSISLKLLYFVDSWALKHRF